VIAFTSEFIPKMVYKVGYSEDGTLKGYTNFTLAYFNPEDFESKREQNLPDLPLEDPYCRYHDYRHPPGN